MSPKHKPIAWLHGEVKTPPFSAEARIEAGYLLRKLQQGDNIGMPHSRPMPSIGPRCHELRINDNTANWRLFYRIDDDAMFCSKCLARKREKHPNELLTCARSD
jgi:phage-related protein